jgi:cytochrome c biogenesis protein
MRLTLWLVAILTLAMAVASLFPQNLPEGEYQRAFGMLGKWLSRSKLTHMYGSWPFVGCFFLLALNLLACALQRTGLLLRREREAPAQLTRADVESRARQERFRLSGDAATAASAVAGRLQQMGYTVVEVPGEEKDQRGLIARRGRLSAWAPVVVHLGVFLVLLGAAWGRLPRNSYHESFQLGAGEAAPIHVAGEAFTLRLKEAGTKYDAQHQPTDYWADAEVLEEGAVVQGATVRPNYPLRYHAVSVTLSSVAPAGLALEVSKGGESQVAPIVTQSDGSVAAQDSYVVLNDHSAFVVVQGLRGQDEQGRPGMAARVMIGRMGKGGHDFESVGWVGEQGVDKAGLHLRLAQAGSGATLTLDRDVGVPVVFGGFLLATLGALFVLSSPRRSVAALVQPRGKGVQVLVGVSASGGSREGERIVQQLESELGAVREVTLRAASPESSE